MADRPTLTVTRKNAFDAPGAQLTLRQHVDSRAKSLMRSREGLDEIAEEVAAYTMPTRSMFLPAKASRPGTASGRVGRNRSSPYKMHDGHGVLAQRVTTHGMQSGLSSPSRPWFKLKIGDADLMRYHPVVVWLEECERIIRDFLSVTNFYQATKSGYGELTVFGNEACYMADHWRVGMACHPLTFGEYWFALNDAGETDTLLRQTPMSTRQMVERFVVDRVDKSKMDWSRVPRDVQTAWDGSHYERGFDVMHLVEPNPAYDDRGFGRDAMAFRSIYWMPSHDSGTILERGGAVEKPFWSARWDTFGNNPWGSGPGLDALADLRDLQAQKKRKADATDYAVKPAMIGPAGIRLNRQPGTYTAVSEVQQGKITAAWQVDYQAIGVIRQDVESCKQAVNSLFYVDLFMAISQMDGVQPRNNEEIFSRNEEKLTQLGPVIERVNNEKLGVAIDRAFGLLLRRGDFPDPPEELQGMELQVDYISMLAQAQRAVGLTSMERSLSVLGSMAATDRGVLDNVDFDEAARDYLDRAGFPKRAMRDPQKRDQMRALAAAQAETARMAELAKPAQDAAKAAEILSQTDVRGVPMLEAMTGGAPV